MRLFWSASSWTKHEARIAKHDLPCSWRCLAIAIETSNPPAEKAHVIRSYHRAPVVECSLEYRFVKQQAKTHVGLAFCVASDDVPRRVKKSEQPDLGHGVL